MEPNQNPISSGDLLYDPARAAQIADTLCELLDPAYILLFGKMAGGTPLSDVLAYDLLVVTDDAAPYDWVEAKRYLKMKIPWTGHGVPYMNIYIHPRREVDTNRLLFHLARQEGIVLHRSYNRKFLRPKMPFDFGQAAAAAARAQRRPGPWRDISAVGRPAGGFCRATSGALPRIGLRHGAGGCLLFPDAFLRLPRV